MRKLLLLGLALLAVYMAGRAARRNAEVIGLLWTLIGLTATASTANTPKARSTEARLSALVPQVFPKTGGTVSGSITVTGNHTVQGALAVTASSSFSNDVTVGNQVNANNFAASGASTTNGLTSHADVNVDTNVTAGGNVSAQNVIIRGTQLNMLQGAGGWPMAPGQAWGPSVVSVLNQLAAALNTSGVLVT